MDLRRPAPGTEVASTCARLKGGGRGEERFLEQEQKKALLTSGDMAGHLCPSAVWTLPLLSPILSPSRFPYSGRYYKRGMASELRALQQPGLEF
eukprot:scaffold23932_cov138-Isochrysis_galbana.AAC.1